MIQRNNDAKHRAIFLRQLSFLYIPSTHWLMSSVHCLLGLLWYRLLSIVNSNTGNASGAHEARLSVWHWQGSVARHKWDEMAIGCQSNSASSTSCVCWYIAACTSYLADLITPSAAATVRPGLRSAASGSAAVPRTISSLGDRSFAASGPRAWNKLPPPLRRVYSPDTFKRQLKTFLYNHAFNSHC